MVGTYTLVERFWVTLVVKVYIYIEHSQNYTAFGLPQTHQVR